MATLRLSGMVTQSLSTLSLIMIDIQHSDRCGGECRGYLSQLRSVAVADDPRDLIGVELDIHHPPFVEFSHIQLRPPVSDLSGAIDLSGHDVSAQMMPYSQPVPMMLFPAVGIGPFGSFQFGIGLHPRLSIDRAKSFPLQFVFVVDALLKLSHRLTLPWFSPASCQSLAAFDDAVLLGSTRSIPMDVDAQADDPQ